MSEKIIIRLAIAGTSFILVVCILPKRAWGAHWLPKPVISELMAPKVRPDDDDPYKSLMPSELAPDDGTAPTQSFSRFCDEDNQNPEDPPHTHSSMRRLEDFAKRVSDNPQPLRPAQCIAIAMYAYTYNMWGEPCADRSVPAMQAILKKCAWRQDNGDWDMGDCLLLDQDELVQVPSIRILKHLLRHNRRDCNWTQEQINNLVTPDVMDEAVHDIENPDYKF